MARERLPQAYLTFDLISLTVWDSKHLFEPTKKPLNEVLVEIRSLENRQIKDEVGSVVGGRSSERGHLRGYLRVHLRVHLRGPPDCRREGRNIYSWCSSHLDVTVYSWSSDEQRRTLNGKINSSAETN